MIYFSGITCNNNNNNNSNIALKETEKKASTKT